MSCFYGSLRIITKQKPRVDSQKIEKVETACPHRKSPVYEGRQKHKEKKKCKYKTTRKQLNKMSLVSPYRSVIK